MQRYWFKNKTYGWGWQPATWEGWLSLAIFILLEMGNWFIRYQPRVDKLTDIDIYYFVAEIWLLVFLFILLCIRFGEKPRWQWGNRVDKKDENNVQ